MGTPKAGYSVTGYGQISGGENQLKAAVQQQSVTVAVNASKWHLYGNGIINTPSWCSGGLNHAVNVVGYGSENGEDYWLVRNSWSKSWGEAGYIRLLRKSGNGNGICGVATYGYWPNVTVPENNDNDDNSGPVSPDEYEPDNNDNNDNNEEEDLCEECGNKWWKSFDCVRCLINKEALKHKWFKSDMSNLNKDQEELLSQELWKMKNEFEKSLEQGNY